jgi:hypothetical protein
MPTKLKQKKGQTMSKYGPIRETLKQAGYTYIKFDRVQQVHVLEDIDGNREAWFANKNHAGYGLIYRNTHLEFARSYKG